MMRQATQTLRPARDFNPEVPEGRQQILDTLLATDPAQRHPTPDKVARDLNESLATGAEVQRLEDEPKMLGYLHWLVGLGIDPESGPEV